MLPLPGAQPAKRINLTKGFITLKIEYLVLYSSYKYLVLEIIKNMPVIQTVTRGQKVQVWNPKCNQGKLV